MAIHEPLSGEVSDVAEDYFCCLQRLTKATSKKNDWAIVLGSIVAFDGTTWMPTCSWNTDNCFQHRLFCKASDVLYPEIWKFSVFLSSVKKVFAALIQLSELLKASPFKLNKVVFCLHGPFNLLVRLGFRMRDGGRLQWFWSYRAWVAFEHTQWSHNNVHFMFHWCTEKFGLITLLDTQWMQCI